jgi:chromosome partitioning protein
MAEHATQRIIAVMNQTHDVGKTTITANLGVILAEMGYRVLMLDLDPQADLSRQFGVPETQSGMDKLLKNDVSISEVILSLTDHLSLIASGPELFLYDQLTPSINMGVQLKQLLTSTISADADIILIDCAALSGLLGTNAVLAATDMLIPVSAGHGALRGMIKMLPVLQRVSKLRPDSLRLWLCLNRLPDGNDFAYQFGTLLTQYFPKRVLKTVIYDNESANPADYQSLANDLLMGRAD